jgi:S-formylglutathione hydrolase FrmB
MDLTSGALLVVLAMVALLAFAMLILGVPRTEHRWLGALARGSEGLLLSLTVLLFAGAALNDQYLFYVSWGDLFGAGATATAMHDGGTTAQALESSAKGVGLRQFRVPRVMPSLPSPGQRLQRYTVTGVRSGITAEVLVYLPPGYDPTSARKYPVIVALHGLPGHPEGYLTGLHIDQTLDALVATHQIAPAVVVIPQINTPSSLDTECVDAPSAMGPQDETWLAHDVPGWVVSHFAVQTVRTSWATMGFSFGGWCSAMLGMRHPDVFAGVIVLEGYFRPDFSRSYDPITAGSAAARGYDLVRTARTSPPPLAMWVMASRSDSLSYPTTAQFIHDARPPLSVSTVLLKSGGHRVAVFLPYIRQSLVWLGQTLPGFRGAH